MPELEQTRRIAARSRGTSFGLWWFRMLIHLLGLRAAYAWLYVVAGYYFLFDRPAIVVSIAYLKRRFPEHSRLRLRLSVYRLFLDHGRALIDRYCLAVKPELFRLRILGYEKIRDAIVAQRKGFVLLTSHVGNWQAVMVALRRMERPVCLLMRDEDNAAVRRTFRYEETFPDLRVISPEQALGGVVELMRLIESGHVVAMMGDRGYGFRTMGVSFVGDTAAFPQGPFSIAAAMDCPVVVLLSARVAPRAYDVEIADVIHPRQEGHTRKQQVGASLQRYADLLNDYLVKYPYQSSLFYDVWGEAASPGQADQPRRSRR